MDMEFNAEQLKREIVDALKAERWEDALSKLEIWCQYFPDHSRSWLNRGYCLVRLGRHREATSALDRCLELDPGHEKAHRWRHRVFEQYLQGSSSAESASSDHLAGGPPATSPPPTFVTRSVPDTTRGWFEGSVIDGRYDVRSVARGGMAVVAIAFDRELLRTVAVKTPLPSVLATADGRARFQREAESWIALENPSQHLLRVLPPGDRGDPASVHGVRGRR